MQHGLPKRQRRLRHFCYKYATAVVAVSDELREYHEEQAECENGTIEVLYNGVDASSFKPRPEVRSQVRRELNIPEDGLVIGFVGRMVALKDVPTLLKAVEILAPETPSIHVLLVGSGPEQAHLQEQVNASPKLANRVTFAGATDKVADLLSAMDVFVLPSLLEGMSNTLLEALATGLPVLATRVGGNCEVVEDGVSGYLFNPQNAGELSIRLRSLLHDQDRRQRFGRAARERATTRFSLDGMLQRYSDFYLRLARQQGVTLPKEDYVRN
jgi:glycosyltransferase involved in cell wall biosynthesis